MLTLPLSEQSPRYTEALINGLGFGGLSDVTNIVTSSCHCQAREGFVMAYPLIMLERLWFRRSKNGTAVDMTRFGSSCQSLMLKGAIATRPHCRTYLYGNGCITDLSDQASDNGSMVSTSLDSEGYSYA